MVDVLTITASIFMAVPSGVQHTAYFVWSIFRLESPIIFPLYSVTVYPAFILILLEARLR